MSINFLYDPPCTFCYLAEKYFLSNLLLTLVFISTTLKAHDFPTNGLAIIISCPSFNFIFLLTILPFRWTFYPEEALCNLNHLSCVCLSLSLLRWSPLLLLIDPSVTKYPIIPILIFPLTLDFLLSYFLSSPSSLILAFLCNQ